MSLQKGIGISPGSIRSKGFGGSADSSPQFDPTFVNFKKITSLYPVTWRFEILSSVTWGTDSPGVGQVMGLRHGFYISYPVYDALTGLITYSANQYLSLKVDINYAVGYFGVHTIGYATRGGSGSLGGWNGVAGSTWQHRFRIWIATRTRSDTYSDVNELIRNYTAYDIHGTSGNQSDDDATANINLPIYFFCETYQSIRPRKEYYPVVNVVIYKHYTVYNYTFTGSVVSSQYFARVPDTSDTAWINECPNP